MKLDTSTKVFVINKLNELSDIHTELIDRLDVVRNKAIAQYESKSQVWQNSKVGVEAYSFIAGLEAFRDYLEDFGPDVSALGIGSIEG